jgi:hypothetical protein
MWVSTTSGTSAGGRAQQFAASALRGDGIEAGIHDNGAAIAPDGEDVEVERVRCRVIVRDDVVLELQAAVEDAVA